jgi:hypothetical protein
MPEKGSIDFMSGMDHRPIIQLHSGKVECGNVDRASYIHRQQGIQGQPLDTRQSSLSHPH